MDKKLLLSAEVQEFILAHESADLNTLVLQRDRYPHLPIPDIANQIKQFCPNAIVLVVSNPLDVLTYFFQKETLFLINLPFFLRLFLNNLKL